LSSVFRRSAEEAGHPGLPLSINSHGYVADTSERAAEEFFPGYATMMNRIGRERGWAPMERPSFDALRTLRGALVVGNPEEVVEKILYQHQLFGHQRFMAQMSVGNDAARSGHALDRATRDGSRTGGAQGACRLHAERSCVIGTLNEGALHAQLKDWYRRPGDLLEHKVGGYVIDLVRDELLVEFQTGGVAPPRRHAAGGGDWSN